MKILCIIILCGIIGCAGNKNDVKNEKKTGKGFSYYFWSIYPWL